MAKKRKSKKKSSFAIGLKKRTVLSIISSLFLLISLILIFSFLQKGVFLARVNQQLITWLGGGSALLPFWLLAVGLYLSKFNTPFKQLHVILGSFLTILSFCGLTKTGRIGQIIWQELRFLVTSFGAFLLLFFSFLISLVILFNTSLDQLIKFAVGVLMNVKNKLFSFPVFKKNPVFVTQQKVKEELPQTDPRPQLSLPATPSLKKRIWHNPPLDVLEEVMGGEADRGNVKENAGVIEKTLDSFGIMARVAEINKGPAVTQYALEVALGTKLSKITALSNDLALALAAPTGQIRIEAPIPGRSLVGIEAPNRGLQVVGLKEILQSKVMKESESKLTVPLGLDVSGNFRVANIAKMPHVLIAGQTGSGKSVLMNAWIATLLMRASPDEVRMILVDPKRVEMTLYNEVPHLLSPVIHEPEKVVSALNWAIGEMDRRYKLFAQVGARNVEGYNEMSGFQGLPFILIFIDELADIILYSPAEVEDSVCRIAQMARATGIHLVLATQRPSVDVLTGLIKANIPSRVSFAVASMTDSRVILDTPGAEKLLGRGDMLYIPPDQAKPSRIQGPFVSDAEVKRLIEFLKKERETVYDERVMTQPVPMAGTKTFLVNGEERDELFAQVAQLIIREKKASASLIQRRLKVGYARAARILDQLEVAGIIGPGQGSKAREILVTNLPPELQAKE
ncbi:DNA translocase FtsK [Candidatus Shapirobacteria bacterium]|nr:DNA translocase FtsK [Candidatus Shapirobacteria bacterium]